MDCNINALIMSKIPVWLRQPLLQILIYVLLYELILKILKSSKLIKMNLNIGITAHYLFYLFLIFSLFFSLFLLLLKKSKLSHSLILCLIYEFTIILFFGINKIVGLVFIISILSILLSYFFNKLPDHSDISTQR